MVCIKANNERTDETLAIFMVLVHRILRQPELCKESLHSSLSSGAQYSMSTRLTLFHDAGAGNNGSETVSWLLFGGAIPPPAFKALLAAILGNPPAGPNALSETSACGVRLRNSVRPIQRLRRDLCLHLGSVATSDMTVSLGGV